MLTLFAANGFVARRDGRVAVTALAREHLTTGSPFHLGPYYASLKDRPVVADFLTVLRTGRPAHWGGAREGGDWHASMATEVFASTFTAAMDCRGLYLGQALARLVDLGGRRRLLDVGGGSGIYACTCVARHPGLEAVVFDQATVAGVAARLIAERGCAGRVSVETGDFFEDPWPDGCDVHLFSNVLHDWDVAEVRRLVRRSWDHLEPGGLLVVHEAFVDADKMGPLPVAEYSTLLMHSTQGKCYSVREYEQVLTETGFVEARFTPTVADRGVMTARKPRQG